MPYSSTIQIELHHLLDCYDENLTGECWQVMLHSNGLPMKLSGLYNPKLHLQAHELQHPGELDQNLEFRETRLKAGTYSYLEFRTYM